MVPGEVLLGLTGAAEPISSCMLTASVSVDRSRLRLHGSSVEFQQDPITAIDYTYVAASELAVAAVEPARSRGERAGAAACAETEAYLEPPVTSAEALSALFAGEWALCQHQMFPTAASIRFDADGRYELVASDGSSVAGGSYAPLGAHAMGLIDDSGDQYALDGVLAFEAPRKLRLALYDWQRELSDAIVLSAQ